MFIEIPDKYISVCFTWDDNSLRHYTHVAPLFLDHNIRCTFYVVPGTEDFDPAFCQYYTDLAEKGFEIGSHSYSHHYMTTLSGETLQNEFTASINRILHFTKRYPLTFAFPNHDYNPAILREAHRFHLETRNTLQNSRRFSIKRRTMTDDLLEALEQSIANGTNLIFSGHSIITEDEIKDGKQGEGYEPMRSGVLQSFISKLGQYSDNIRVQTFSQASIKQWFQSNAKYLGECKYELSDENLASLAIFGINNTNIFSYL